MCAATRAGPAFPDVAGLIRATLTATDSARAAIANQMLSKESYNARVEIAVKGCPVEARHIGANPRYRGRELLRAGRQECKMSGRHEMNLGLARQAACDARRARTVAHARTSPFGSPELQGDFDGSEIVRRKNAGRRIDNHRGPDTRILRRAGRSFSVLQLPTGSRPILAEAGEPAEIRRSPNQHQAGIASLGKTEEADPSRIDHRFVLPTVQHEVQQTNHVHRTRRPDGEVVGLRGVVAVVAWMVDGGDDKAGIGQRLCGVMMCAEPPGATV